MRKIIIYSAIAVLSVSLFGCSAKESSKIADNAVLESNTDEAETQNVNASTGIDYTVICDCVDYTPEQLSNTISVSAECSFAYSVSTLESLVEHSDDAIKFTVYDIRYTVIEGTPYTIYDVLIEESYTGYFNQGDEISLLQYGGYMTIQDEIDYYQDDYRFADMTDKEKNDTLIEKRSTSAVDMQLGDNYVAFIAEEDVLEGAYYTLNEGEGIFEFENESTLVRCTGNYTENEMELETLNSIDKTVDLSE
ncbi:MAG: hypothetical protein LUG91_00650 [Ruminococcus sp.]|nr:hypothetical protein [Ruminococcus sp.]